MKTLMQLFSLCLLAAMAFPAAADVTHNETQVGPYTVNFSAFNSQFVPADIAALHQIVRGRDQALINVAVLDTRTGQTVPVALKGAARNLLQQSKTLDFTKVEEPDAVYYLASLRHTNEDVYHFDLTVTLDGVEHKLKFTRKLYVERQ